MSASCAERQCTRESLCVLLPHAGNVVSEICVSLLMFYNHSMQSIPSLHAIGTETPGGQERMTPIAEEGCTKANIKCWSRSSELASIEHQK